MGMLINGSWTEEDRIIESGAFVREPSVLRDVDPGTADAIATQPGRFQLIASWTCPWSHRLLLVRALKGLSTALPVQLAGGRRVEGYPLDHGRAWRVPGTDRDIVHLHELYTMAVPDYTGRSTVPVLWDSQARRIVSNDSAALMRLLDAVPGEPDFTLTPASLLPQIDTLNDWIYGGLSNAVYRTGFAESQAAYDRAIADVVATLDQLEARLADRRFLLGSTVTEADWRLFPTLVRFDVDYFIHSRCSHRRLTEYPNLWAYARDLYAWPGVAQTVDFDAIHRSNHEDAPILPILPFADWRAAHTRDRLGPRQVVMRDGRHERPVS